MSLIIYSYPGNYRVNKAKIAAAYNGVKLSEPAFNFGVDNKTPEFLAKNAQGKVPVLETPEGCIFESNAIARYVARLRADTHLLGKGFHEAALVDQWMDFSTTELEPARGLWLYPIQGYLAFNPKAYAEAKKGVAQALGVLNQHLLYHTFLVGNQITMADITIAASLVDLYKMVFAPEFIEPFGNVTRWFTTLINQPQFASVVGKVEFAKEETHAPKGKEGKEEKGSKKGKDKGSSKGEQGSQKGGEKKEKKEKKEKAPKEPKEEKPKEEKKKKKEEEEEDGGEEDDIAAQEAAEAAKKKKDHPLLKLPKSTMELDATKKLFFNKLPYNPDFWTEFWPTFDKEGYSFFSSFYNYDDENTVYFQSQNHLGGFLQRADECRKYAFGVLFLYGIDEDTPPYRTGGCWLFRGQDLTPEMKEHPSSEYFTWTKLSTETDEDKAAIKAFFLGDSCKGLPILDRRYLK